MKVFLIQFAYQPGEDEEAVVVAKDVEEAMNIMITENSDKRTKPTFVDKEKDDLKYYDSNKIAECRISEVDITEPGIVYAGYNCC